MTPVPLFDLAVCRSSLPHLARRAAAFGERRRVLAPGEQVLIVHDLPRERVDAIHSKTGGAIAHDLLPSGGQLEALLLAAGFTDVWVEESALRYVGVGRRK